MTKEEIREALELHQKWLRSEKGGKKQTLEEKTLREKTLGGQTLRRQT